VVLAMGGCNALPVPHTGPHSHDKHVVVPEMPPPNKVEKVPARPAERKHPVWIGGQWTWTGQAWTWKDGSWEEEREDEEWVPPVTVCVSESKTESKTECKCTPESKPAEGKTAETAESKADCHLVHYPGRWSEKSLVVPYGPPPGKVEIIPDRPAEMKHPVWIDGQWLWTGRRWTWKDGGWEEERWRSYYAPPKTVRTFDGTLRHYPGIWKKEAPPEAPGP
jgi:hypothetical protein